MTDESVSFSFGNCKICTGKAMGVHYGTATCEGCKAFFKRWMDREKTLTCYFGGNCVITPDTRHCCKGCRFRKCKENGMSIEAIKMGRIPKVEKTAAIEDLKRSKREGNAPSLSNQRRPQKKTIERKSCKNNNNKKARQDNNISSILDPNPHKADELLQWSPLEHCQLSNLDGLFNDDSLSINVLDNDSNGMTTSNVEDGRTFSHDGQEPNNNNNNNRFLDHQAQNLLHTESNGDCTTAKNLQDKQMSHNNHTNDHHSSQHYFSQYGTSNLHEISPDAYMDTQTTEINNDHLSSTQTPVYASSTAAADHQREYIDRAIINSIFTAVDDDCPDVYQTSNLPAPPKVTVTDADTARTDELGDESAQLHNYVRLLTTLSENETIGLGSQWDLAFGKQLGATLAMDTSSSPGGISESTPGPDVINSNLAFQDQHPGQAVSRSPSTESEATNRDTDIDRGVVNETMQGDGDSRPFTSGHQPGADINQLDNIPRSESHGAKRLSNLTVNEQIDKGTNATFNLLRSQRLDRLATAIFVNLNGSKDPSEDNSPNSIAERCLNQAGRSSKITRTSPHRGQTDNDIGHDVMATMKRTLGVFHRSVDRLYIPIFLRKRIAMKSRSQQNGQQQISARTKERMGYLLSKFLKEIKTENERITGFATEMPGFSCLSRDDQMVLLKRAFIEIYLLTTAKDYTDESLVIEENNFALDETTLNAFVDDQLMDNMNRLHELLERFGLSNLEIGLLCAIQLTSLDGLAVEDAGSVEGLHSHYLDVFSYMLYSSQRDNKARMVVEIFFNLIPVLKSLSKSINHFMESVVLEENAEQLFEKLL
ncbi:uncharacterized protein [Argopecten irradians]|uniref:uncharacterized protein n=1 Tax=Argopecten irradians TaxID=31199 RepID=UPI0037131976